jgi:hypothetical protein
VRPRHGRRIGGALRARAVVVGALTLASLGATASSAAAVGEPTVETKAASPVAPTSATLNGSVNPNGSEVTECKFEYGTTTAYGSSAPCSPEKPAGGSPVSVSAAISGLAEGTTYHFKLVAKNAGGPAETGDATFKTTSTPVRPTVKTEPASPVTQTSATLTALVNPNGFEVTECKLEYGTSISYGQAVPCSPPPGSGSGSVAVSGAIAVVANTTYHYRVVAKNAGGTSEGEDRTFKSPPNPPTVLTEGASSVTQTGASLTGTVNANGGPISACSFEYGTTTAYGFVVPCPALPASGEIRLSVAIAGLAASTTYHYRIAAANQGGASVGADQTFTTPPPAPPSPSPPPGTVTRVTTVVVVPDSTFKVLGATLNLRNYWITFTESVHDPGTFTWVLTFKNGPFGAFAAGAKACRAGRVRLKGRCRPSRVMFAKGSQYVPAPGNASFTVVPTAAGVSALKNAFKRKASLPVRAVVIFQSVHGGQSVTHIQKLVVKLRR